jgi:hypothetical protein
MNEARVAGVAVDTRHWIGGSGGQEEAAMSDRRG